MRRVGEGDVAVGLVSQRALRIWTYHHMPQEIGLRRVIHNTLVHKHLCVNMLLAVHQIQTVHRGGGKRLGEQHVDAASQITRIEGHRVGIELRMRLLLHIHLIEQHRLGILVFHFIIGKTSILRQMNLGDIVDETLFELDGVVALHERQFRILLQNDEMAVVDHQFVG